MRPVRRQVARTLDFAMCVMMNRIQRRHLLDAGSHAAFDAYLTQCQSLTPAQFFAAPPRTPQLDPEPLTGIPILRWDTPVPSGHPANDRAHVLLFTPHPGAPTVLMLHALASTSDKGYRQWAHRFNAAGWNACFVHLPYHYSRVPPGCHNGELAISPDLVRTGQGLRQGVAELRQLMQWFRAQGVHEFGLWATSYGGWIGALLLGIEPDFRFAVLQAPIVNVAHAIWQSGAARHMRAELTRVGITQSMVQRHEHLTFPMRVHPACGSDRVILAAGIWDQMARAEDIAALHRQWHGSTYLTVEQGHFGFRMAERCYAHLVSRRLLATGKIQES
jgi:pimeloyl-ACP methyl ester carboxylesterase